MNDEQLECVCVSCSFILTVGEVNTVQEVEKLHAQDILLLAHTCYTWQSSSGVCTGISDV